MKRFKKILGLFLVAALVLSTPVLAAPSGTGTDTDPFVESGNLGDTTYNGTITIHKYDIAAWEKAKNADPLSGKDPGYTIKYFGLNAVGTEIPASGQVGYYYLSAADEAAGTSPQQVALSELAAVSNIVFRLTSATPQAGKEGSSDPDDYDIAAIPAIDYYGKTAAGEFKWTGVPKGYYILEEIANAAAEDPPQTFVVSMPMFAPTNTQATNPVVELKDIHIYPKNQIKSDPDVKKEFTANFQNGNVISWKITAEIPGDIATSKKYTISDTFSKGLALLTTSIVVTKSATKDVAGSPLAPTEYTVVAPTTNSDGTTTFAIDFNDTQRPALAGSVELVITYDTVVNLTKEEWDAAKQVSNDAMLEFTNNDGYEFKPKVPPITVSALAELEIHKIDGVTEEDLAGATFQIYTKESAGAVVAGSVFLDKSGNPANLVTDTGGIASFYGLPEGTYYLVETSAPNQYKILDGHFEFEVTQTQAAGNSKVMVGPVKNFLDSGFTLPQTGGPGTLWFTIIGVGLVLVGGLAYVLYRRRRDKAA